MPVDCWCCKKCGETFSHAWLRAHPDTRCPGCSEPDLDLFTVCGMAPKWDSPYPPEPEDAA